VRPGDYVFGFGSLVRLGDLARYMDRPAFAPDEVAVCRLRGYRRLWNIARDNSIDLPGRAPYFCAHTGERLPVFITVLNICLDKDRTMNGMAIRVDADDIALLDRREASYDRIDVTRHADIEIPGRLWVYRGKTEAEARYRSGHAQGKAVVSTSYHESVAAGFAEMGSGQLAEYFASSDPPDVPLRALVRSDLPPYRPPRRPREP
jgi:cation transport regulator ChaC